MKTKILIAASLAALVVPAASFGSGPTGQDRENGARACHALRASLGLDLFRQTYGTVQSKRRNAMGRCVSHVDACRAPEPGQRPRGVHRRAGRPELRRQPRQQELRRVLRHGLQRSECLRQVRVLEGEGCSRTSRRATTLNAARSCKAERSSMEGPAFRAKYGKNANDRNAFGKCVSQLVEVDHLEV